MSKELVISATPHETRVAIVEDGQLCEIYIEREKEFALVGSLYKGRVTRVLPGMQSAFVDIGLDSDAFLYVSDFLEHLEDYDHVAPVEHKFQKPPQPIGEVFAPSTTHAGVAHEPVVDAAHAADDAGSTWSPQESRPDSAWSPQEPGLESNFAPNASTESWNAPETGAPSTDSAPSTVSNAAVPPAPPVQRTQRPFEQRPDRGRGGFNDRGGRGGGRNRRWGRQGGGRGRQQRGDLPPSKYASPKPFDSRPRESQPYEPPPADYQPIILPGESLAKYKDRIPAAPAPAAPPVEAAAGIQALPAEPQTSTDFVRDSAHDESSLRSSSGLPDSLYASSSAKESVLEKRDESIAKSLPTEAFLSASPVAYPQQISEPEIARHELEHESEIVETADTAAQSGASLSDDEVSSLAEQLAEAKHEEAQAEVDELPNIEEKGAEPFVEAAELEDLQDALHDDHVADAEEAEEVADAMHDEALAADSATEHAEEHAESGSTKSEGSASAGEWNSQETQETQHDVAGAPPPSSSETQPTSARISDQPRARFQRPMRRGGNRQRGGPRRGGRPNEHRHQQHSHQGQRHEQHRRPLLISEMLKAGEEIIVQIAKEPLGKKGARITSHVALPGRYLVYMPTVDHIGVSRRIGSAEDRSRLRRVVTEAKGTFPGGFIVRTAAADASDDEIRTDVEFLGRTWDTIRATSEQRRAPSLLHRDLNLVERILRDYLSEDYVAIWLDNEEAFTKVVEFVGRFQPKMVPRVKLYTKEAPIFEEFGIQQELDKALRPKVWLKSGGYIVINHTEALVAIDVNTGKYVGRGSTRLEDTIVKTNLEAVKEIVRQIRLRDLGGIIVVDFIDMEERRNRDKVMAALDQALNQDRAPSKALSFNEFGLVCITRKRTKQALERVLCQPCPYCTGSGMVKSIPTICYEIQTEARKMSADMDARSLTLRVNPEIAKALKTRESSLIEELEQATRKSVIIQSDPTLHWEQYDIY
ncbi:MAG: rng [Candidatus Acidoferrum typicum]|nr:rng [Candidatus Acidoferrum typicum]